MRKLVEAAVVDMIGEVMTRGGRLVGARSFVGPIAMTLLVVAAGCGGSEPDETAQPGPVGSSTTVDGRQATIIADTQPGTAESTSTTADPTTTTSTTTSVATTSTTTAPTTVAPTTVPPTTAAPFVPDPDAKVIITPSGFVAAVTDVRADGYLVLTPCSNETVIAAGDVLRRGDIDVVLDPGHGGNEKGATGPNGLTEKEVNLAISLEAAQLLRAGGFRVLTTRDTDVRLTLKARGAIATALAPQAFVSVHHNAEPDGSSEGPGSETYFQIENPESRRLAGLIYEELVDHLDVFDIDWVADTDAGAKFRTASRGGDYYGVLRRTAGVNSVLSEAAFLSNPAEAEAMTTTEFRTAEARAIADAVTRFIRTNDPGSGYSEPYPRTAPAGPGGGTTNCVDPDLARP